MSYDLLEFTEITEIAEIKTNQIKLTSYGEERKKGQISGVFFVFTC